MTASRWARRQSGVSTREPGRIRNTDASGTGCVSFPGRCRRSAYAQALDPPRVGIEHFEFDAQWVSNDFAALRHAPGKARDQSTQGVHLFLVAVRAQPSAFMLLEHLYRGAGIGDQAAVAALDEAPAAGHIVLVLDLTDNFLDQAFDRDHPVDPPEFVDHHRKMGSCLTLLDENVENPHPGRD